MAEAPRRTSRARRVGRLAIGGASDLIGRIRGCAGGLVSRGRGSSDCLVQPADLELALLDP